MRRGGVSDIPIWADSYTNLQVLWAPHSCIAHRMLQSSHTGNRGSNPSKERQQHRSTFGKREDSWIRLRSWNYMSRHHFVLGASLFQYIRLHSLPYRISEHCANAIGHNFAIYLDRLDAEGGRSKGGGSDTYNGYKQRPSKNVGTFPANDSWYSGHGAKRRSRYAVDSWQSNTVLLKVENPKKFLTLTNRRA